MLPNDMALRVLAAGRTDMEFQTRTPAARHYVENLLAAFNTAISSGSREALADLTRGVVMSIHDGNNLIHARPEDVINLLTPSDGKTVHTITNLSIMMTQPTVQYTATYQTWRIKRTGPGCSGLGHLYGNLLTGPQVWRWESHNIVPVSL